MHKVAEQARREGLEISIERLLAICTFAGNAMTSTVVGAAILAGLIVGRKCLPPKPEGGAEGAGAMEVDGVGTGVLTPGTAVHLPPGTVHSGHALPADHGAHFRMAYFAILDDRQKARGEA